MKSNIYLFVALLFLACSGCKEDDKQELISVYPEKTGTFEDSRDGNEYTWVRYDGRDWMVQNLKAKATKGSYKIYYPDNVIEGDLQLIQKQNFERYGYLYDQTAALSAIPEGWRLPTDEDWQSLERTMGMSEKDAGRTEWRGSMSGELLKQGKEGTGINLQCGGYYGYYDYASGNTGSLKLVARLIDIYGFFWTSSVDESTNTHKIYYRKICYNKNSIFRNSTEATRMMSVRCVRDAVNN